MIAFFGLAQQVAGAALNRLDTEVEKHLEHLAQGEQDRLTVDQRQHVGTEVALQRRELEQIVQHHLRVGITAQLHHDPHAIAIALIADVRDALQLLVVDQLCDPLNQRCFVGLIGQLRDDHRIAVRATGGFDRFNRRHPTHGDGATPPQIGFADPVTAQDLSSSGEVGARDQPDQLLIRDVGVLDQRQQATDQLVEVVGRDVRRHPDGDAG